jgi:hypothetical protein
MHSEGTVLRTTKTWNTARVKIADTAEKSLTPPAYSASRKDERFKGCAKEIPYHLSLT